MNNASLSDRLRPAGFLFAIVAKFWLIWESEIADAHDDPHEYVLQVLFPANGGLAYGPGTGMAGRLFYDAGFPFRLGIEIAFLFAVALVLKALFDWPWKSWLSLGLFFVITFDPNPAELFSHFYSDQVWLVEILVGFSFFVLALKNEGRPNWILLAIGALSLALANLTRSTTIPLMAGLVLFGAVALALVFLKNRGPKVKGNLIALALSMITLFLIIGLIYQAMRGYNLRRFGFDGISAIDSVEYKKFYFCLQSVGEPTGSTYFPIDEDRRELIAKAGSTSKWFMEEMDPNGYYRQLGVEYYGKRDIAAGWLQFAIFSEAYRGSDGDLRNCFALFRKIEDEIAAANARGVIKVRSIVPFPDTRIQIVAGAYPTALMAIIDRIAYEPPVDALAWERIRHYDDRDFTRALHRRTIEPSPIRDQVWGYLCRIYYLLFSPLIVLFYLAVWAVFLALFAIKWNKITELSTYWMAQQIFGLFFVILIFWYALFDASGWPALSRYMIFNHVLLPAMLAYYVSEIVRLSRLGRG